MFRSAVRKDDEVLQEAVDRLAKIIEINPDEWMKAKVKERKRYWIDITNGQEVNQAIRSTLHLIYEYLRKNFSVKRNEMDSHAVKGFSAIWVLAQEAADKIDQINSVFHTEITQSIRDSKEYKELEIILQQKLSYSEQEEFTFPPEFEQDLQNEAHLSVKTLDAVKKDQQYELFYIKQEDGSSFFSPQLVRNIKHLIDFEQMILLTEGKDPFISLSAYQDRLIYSMAKSIKEKTDRYTNSFITIYHRFSGNEIARCLYKAIMALYLASLLNNRIEAKRKKVCSQYFHDFLYFLHEAIYHPQYQKMAYEIEDTSSDLYRLIQTARALCYGFYTAETRSQFEHQYLQEISRGYTSSKGHIWQRISQLFSFISEKLKVYPSGPLMKILDLWTSLEKVHIFDPLMMKNYPKLAYKGRHEHGEWGCVHLPAPVHQSHIHQVSLLKEFTESLLYIEENHHHKWVIFNLQDRTSYYEVARSNVLEEFQYRAPYQKALTVITLPKNSEFYHQSNHYAEMNSAESFLAAFFDQLSDEQISSFFFPQEIRHIIEPFLEKAMHWLHKRLFHGMEIMNKELRQDFIEIFLMALSGKILAQIGPSLFSFVSKDGIDLGAVSEAGFYTFMLLMQDKLTLDSGEKIEILSLFPALFQRERLPDQEVFNRMLRSLSTLDNYLQKTPGLSKEFLELLDMKGWKFT